MGQPFVGLPMLAFGDAVYQGPVADPNFVAWQNSQQYCYPQQPGYPPQYPRPPHARYPPQQ